MPKIWHVSSPPGSKNAFNPLNIFLFQVQMLQVPRAIFPIKQLLPKNCVLQEASSYYVLKINFFADAAPNCSDPEPGVVLVEEDRHPVERVHEALQYLPQYDPSLRWTTEEKPPFLYWKIRDFAHAYRSGITTPSIVSTSCQSV